PAGAARRLPQLEPVEDEQVRRVASERLLQLLEQAAGFLEFDAGEVAARLAEKRLSPRVLVERPDKDAGGGVSLERVEYALGEGRVAGAPRGDQRDDVGRVGAVGGP